MKHVREEDEELDYFTVWDQKRVWLTTTFRDTDSFPNVAAHLPSSPHASRGSCGSLEQTWASPCEQVTSHDVQDQQELLDKLRQPWESCARAGTQTTTPQVKHSISDTPAVDTAGPGPGPAGRLPVCRAGPIPQGQRGRKTQAAELSHRPGTDPPPPHTHTGVTDSPLISEAGARPFTEPFSCVSGIFSVCEITKKHLLAPLSRGAARLCVSHLRRLFAHRLLISHFPQPVAIKQR